LLDDAVPVLLQGISNFCRFSCQNLTPYHNDDVSRRQSMLIPAKTLAKKPFQRIPVYRFSDLFPGDGKSEARAVARIFSNQNCHPVIATSNIVLKYLLKIDCAG